MFVGYMVKVRANVRVRVKVRGFVLDLVRVRVGFRVSDG